MIQSQRGPNTRFKRSRTVFAAFVACILLTSGAGHIDAQTLEGLTEEQQLLLATELSSRACDCGCEMNVLECLNDDPNCDRSKELAEEIVLAMLQSQGSGSVQAPRTSSGGGAVPSDRGTWHQRLSGKLLVYISTGMGVRTKECTWLYDDGSFDSNTQGGSVSSLGTGAWGGGSRGRWGVRNDVITMIHPSGKEEVYTLSSWDRSQGILYLDHWRYFLVEHDSYTCQ